MKNPEGPGVRVDSGIYAGYEVTMFYDPVLAKLIVWAEDRETARHRMIEALSDYVIVGTKTTIPFLKDVMHHPGFVSGETPTDFIKKNLPGWKEAEKEDFLYPALIAAAIKKQERKVSVHELKKKTMSSPWRNIGSWKIGER